jgi:hypothetical protein
MKTCKVCCSTAVIYCRRVEPCSSPMWIISDVWERQAIYWRRKRLALSINVLRDVATHSVTGEAAPPPPIHRHLMNLYARQNILLSFTPFISLRLLCSPFLTPYSSAFFHYLSVRLVPWVPPGLSLSTRISTTSQSSCLPLPLFSHRIFFILLFSRRLFLHSQSHASTFLL